MLKTGNKSMGQDCRFDDPVGIGTGHIPLAINGFWRSRPVFQKKSLFEKTILKDEMYFEEMNRQ
jgi:hypothetical protein